MNQNTSNCLHGLFAALIGGGASAVVSGVTVSAIDPANFNLSTNLGHTAELAATLFVVNGLLSAFAYLKQSPLPAEAVEVTETKTSVVSVTPKDGV
jgi:hypothetical protein